MNFKRLLKMNAFFLISFAILFSTGLAATISITIPSGDAITGGGTPVYQSGTNIAANGVITPAFIQNVEGYRWKLDGSVVAEVHTDILNRGTQYTSHFFDSLSVGQHKINLEGWGSFWWSLETSVYVYINAPPIASAGSDQTATAGQSISFNALGSTDPDGYITLYQWDFDNNGVYDALGASVAYIYNTPGTYTVNLKVTDNYGGVAYDQAVVTVNPNPAQNQPPVASFLANPSSGNVPLTVNFDASASYDSDGTITSYSWNFGDGSSATGVTLTHTYSLQGTYIAILTVTDNQGKTDTEQVTISATSPPQNKPPIASITYSPSSGTSPLYVSFSGSNSYDPDGTITAYAWDFGDGATANVRSTVHAFVNIGSNPVTFTVTLTVTDNGGLTDDSEVFVTVNPQQAGNPTVTTTAAPTSGNTPLAVSFTCSASGGTPLYTYFWAFGDGTTSTTQNPTHTYTTAGTFTAVCTVTDSATKTGSSSQTITAGNPSDQPPIALFTANPSSGNVPLTVNFDASASYDSDGTITSYSWNFGDGSTDSGVTTAHIYTSVGTFTATLTLTDNGGATNSTSRQITVNAASNHPPIALFTVNASSGYAPLAVLFNATTSYDSDGSIISYAWAFGDGQTSFGSTAVHTYNTPNTYTAVLTITDNQGAINSTSTQITVSTPPIVNQPPVARFTYTNSSQFNFQFIDSSYDSDGAITSREWFFEDTNRSTMFSGDFLNITRGVNNYTIVLLNIGQSGSTLYGVFNVMQNSTATQTLQINNNDTGEFFTNESGYSPLTLYVKNILGLGSSLTVEIGGGAVNLTTPIYTFPTTGYYDVRLKAIDDDGAVNATLRTIGVPAPDQPPVANAGPSMTVYRNTTVNFTGNGTDSDGYITLYEWDFNGDGTFDYSSTTSGNASYNYTTLGIYNAMLRVTDNAGLMANSTATIVVTLPGDVSPTANAGSDQTVLVNTPVTFVGTGFDPDGTITLYQWDFDGDGIYDWSSASTGVTSYTYTVGGLYTARLRVTDNAGLTGTDLVAINVVGPNASSQTNNIYFNDYYRLSALNVVRVYRYNSITALTTYTLRVTNLLNQNRSLLMREIIPKTFAQNVNDITFTQKPDIVYNQDPEVGWNETLLPFGTFEVSLTFNSYISFVNFSNMTAPNITEYKGQGNVTGPQPQPPSSFDVTGFVTGVFSNPWFGAGILVIVIALGIGYWKRERVIEIWGRLKARLE